MNYIKPEITINTLRTMPLRQVSDLYGNGYISRELAQEYADLWNAGPHFTTAIVGAFTIVNVDHTPLRKEV